MGGTLGGGRSTVRLQPLKTAESPYTPCPTKQIEVFDNFRYTRQWQLLPTNCADGEQFQQLKSVNAVPLTASCAPQFLIAAAFRLIRIALVSTNR